ncbi:MAG: nif-specific transcriptional activator NifA [Candidatus Tectomicrobia bacterium]|nr:nif-specific transcriptional activator NifA [Candidatus Tectomicrobia bacterium]
MTPTTTEERSQTDELETLYEISQALGSSFHLESTLQRILEILHERMGMNRGTITLIEPESNELSIEAALGLSERQKRRGKYKIGEGITGKVVESGQPVIVPNIGQEPLFLNRTGGRGDLKKRDVSFICVPIKDGDNAVGALSVDRLFNAEIDFIEDVRLLSVIAAMIAQTIKLNRLSRMETDRLLTENVALKRHLQENYQLQTVIGNSTRMKEVYKQVSNVANSNATVLLRSESGTGKGLVAQAIHYSSQRADGPFIKVNCTTIPEGLIESELFGHEKGAFTGALEQKKGRFELAEGGTIFLDEVGDLNHALQTKFLRILQEREFERLGGTETLKANVRVIAATNKNLEQAVKDGAFREDLYYRLNVFAINLPPLRERKSDIPILAEFFLEKYARENHKPIRRISSRALDLFMNYNWPGNVRELENCIERAVVMCQDTIIYAHHLPPNLQTAGDVERPHNWSLTQAVGDFERELIIEALSSTRGNRARAARLLGVTERIIGYKVSKYKIDCQQFAG